MRSDTHPEPITVDRESLRAVIQEALEAVLTSTPNRSPEPLLTKAQVAEYLSVSVRTVDLLVSEGALVPVHVRSVRRFTKDGVDRYLRRQTK